MSSNDTTRLDPLEQWSAPLFFVGAVMFVVSSALAVPAAMAGEWGSLELVSQAFIGAGWFAAMFGLLGLYPRLADRSRWLARAGAVFAVIGAVGFALLAVTSLVAFFRGGEPGEVEFLIPIVFIIPGVFAGSFFAFVSFSGASLRNDVLSRTVGILLLVPTAIFLTNVLVLPAIFEPTQNGLSQPPVGLGVTIVLTLAMGAIGYVLRTEGVPVDRPEAEPSPESAAR